jgi:hypothetical protein
MSNNNWFCRGHRRGTCLVEALGATFLTLPPVIIKCDSVPRDRRPARVVANSLTYSSYVKVV